MSIFLARAPSTGNQTSQPDRAISWGSCVLAGEKFSQTSNRLFGRLFEHALLLASIALPRKYNNWSLEMDKQSEQYNTSPPSHSTNQIIQWVVFIVATTLALISLAGISYIGVPGVSAPLVYTAIAIAVSTAVIHIPTIMRRLPEGSRWPYVALLCSPIFTIFVVGNAAATWDRTPAGTEQAAQRARQAAKDDRTRAWEVAERENAARLLEAADTAQADLEDLNNRLERCFTTVGHRLPALESLVKSSLHNPSAYEHIETIVTVPDNMRNNVVMRFRAENGFGAIRVGQVRAQLLADSCSVQNITEPVIQ